MIHKYQSDLRARSYSRNLKRKLQQNLAYRVSISWRLQSRVFSFFSFLWANLTRQTNLWSTERVMPITSTGLNFSNTAVSQVPRPLVPSSRLACIMSCSSSELISSTLSAICSSGTEKQSCNLSCLALRGFSMGFSFFSACCASSAFFPMVFDDRGEGIWDVRSIKVGSELIGEVVIQLMKGKKSKQEVQEASTLINELTDENLEKRVNAAKRLRFIAEVLGGERVKGELIPFLRKEVIFDEAAVVTELFQQIEALGEVMGGGTAYPLLLPLLQDALEYEEEKVRKRVAEKYFECIQLCDFPKSQALVTQSLRKLYAHEYDEVKEAFCCVVARKLGHFTAPTQQEFMQNYTALAESPSTQRRRYAAKHAKDLVGWIGVAQAGVLKVVEVLTKDKEEANKIYLIDAIIELAKVKPPATLQSYFNIISYQFTWRIRYELISKVERLAQAMGKENFKSFLGYYVKYINDIEPEIRSIANSKLQEILPFLEVQDIMNRILPALKAIPQDTQPYVRNSLANSLLHLCPVIGKKNTIEAILPKFLSFLKDQQEQQVKQTIFKKVHLICETLGIETLSQSVMPVLEEMMLHQNWRVRAESINILGYLIKNSPLAFLTDKIAKAVLDYLKDRANAVRKEGVKLILKIIEQHGQGWTEKNLIPKMLPMFKSPTFLHRQTILLSLETLIPKLSPQCLAKQIFPNVQYLVQDPVENVRMSACLAVAVLHQHLPKEKQAIRKLARVLRQDKDTDVKELALKTLNKVE